MKITIITACYNSERTIYHSIKSVMDQDFEDVEHIIVDGNSQDKTLDIVNSFSRQSLKVISEPDNGIYDAMNKGIRAAKGDIIGFLNSDDFYTGNDVISYIVKTFETHSVDCVFGNINYVQAKHPHKIVRNWRSGSYAAGSFRKGWHPAHPAFFVKRSVYDNLGLFDLNFKLAADFEIMLRFLERFKISNYYVEESLINMRIGGATNSSLKNILVQNIECFRAFKINQIQVSPLYPFLRLLPKLKQYF